MSSPQLSRSPLRFALPAVIAAVVLLLVVVKPVRNMLIRGLGGVPAGSDAVAAPDAHAEKDGHEGHDHGHAGHKEENSIELSAQARKSIGLKEGEVALSTYQRTITIPGMVVERPGRSRYAAIAPMTGFLTKILVTAGETVVPDQPLFEIRLTHEELVQAQADLLRTTSELDVVRREIARLEGIGPEGVVATKVILERKYELQKLEAVQLAQRQALLLHGLSEAQVNAIMTTRTLLGTMIVRAPGTAATDGGSGTLVVAELSVDRGQHVNAGDTLATLVDHGTLLVEGDAFEHDMAAVTTAAAEGRPITALVETAAKQVETIDNLRIAYVADRITADSRTLRFFVTLPNDLIGNPRAEGESRFVTWRFKPGQRMQLRVPVEAWPERIVLPADAVAQESVENYVFRANGDHFDREPVHIEYRDPQWVVIANDGTLFPGDRVAMSAAQQLHLALKNKAGGGIDPHAGHNH